MTSGAARTAAKLGLTHFVAAALLIAVGGRVLAADRPLSGGTSRDESAGPGETRTYRIDARIAARRPSFPCGSAMRWRSSCAGRQRPRRPRRCAPKPAANRAPRDVARREADDVDGRRRSGPTGSAHSTIRLRFRRNTRSRKAIVAEPPPSQQLASAQALRSQGRQSIGRRGSRALPDFDRRLEERRRFLWNARMPTSRWLVSSTRSSTPRRKRPPRKQRSMRPAKDGVAECALADAPARQRIHQPGRFCRRHTRNRASGRSVRGNRRRLSAGRCAAQSGPCVRRVGRSRKSAVDTHAALDAAKTAGDEKLLALVRNDLAFMYDARGEFALAVDAYRQTLDTFATNPYPMAEAVAWINLGIAYGQLGDGDEGDGGATRKARASRRRSIAGRASPRSRSIAATICSMTANRRCRDSVQTRARNRREARSRAPTRRGVARPRPLARWRRGLDARAQRCSAKRATNCIARTASSTNRSSSRCSAISRTA